MLCPSSPAGEAERLSQGMAVLSKPEEVVVVASSSRAHRGGSSGGTKGGLAKSGVTPRASESAGEWVRQE
jgi:hypothetical protein